MAQSHQASVDSLRRKVRALEKRLSECGAERDEALLKEREALEQQTATAEILRVISSSPTDIQPSFDAIAKAATTLSGAALGGVFTYERLEFQCAKCGTVHDQDLNNCRVRLVRYLATGPAAP